MEIHRRSLYALFLVNLGISLASELVIPLQPLFIQSLGASVVEVGLVLSVSGFAATALIIPSSLLAERYGEKKIIILSVVLASTSVLLYSLVNNWIHLSILVAIYTVSFTIFIPARMVYIAEASLSENRASIYGLMNVAWPLGSLVAPVLAGIIVDNYGWSLVFIFASIIMALCLIPAKAMRDTKRLNERRETDGGGVNLRSMLKTVALLMLFHVLISLTVGVSHSLLSIYASERFNASATQVGFMFSIIGLATLIAQLSAAYILKKFPLKRFLQLCTLLMVFLYAVLPSIGDLNVFTAVYAVSYGLYSATWPASATLLTVFVPSSKWGLSMGFRQTAVRLGFSLASIIAGLLWSCLGSNSVFYVSSILATLTIATVLLLRE